MSDLCHRTFAEAKLRERFGVNVVGAWTGGDFITPVDPATEIEAGSRLLVAGWPDQVEALVETTASTLRKVGPQEIIIGGYGDSGQAAYDALMKTGSHRTLLDIEAKGDVEIVGDACDPSIMTEAGIENATAILLALGDDTAVIFATLIARDLNPELRIVVRANEEENVQQLYPAGADYVQSLATVSGRMLASTVLEAEEVLSYDPQVSVVQRPVDGLAGRTLADGGVRTTRGCTVVAVIRAGEAITEIDPAGFEFREDDEVVIAGTDGDIARFERRFSE